MCFLKYVNMLLLKIYKFISFIINLDDMIFELNFLDFHWKISHNYINPKNFYSFNFLDFIN